MLMDATYRLPSGDVYSKYFYSATMDEKHLVHGAMGRNLGIWIIMPSHEHLNGGPEHQELTVHQTDTTPVLLCHYNAGHYGAGGISSNSQDGSWSRASAPWFVYVNEVPDRGHAMAGCQTPGDSETSKWPYPWLNDARFQVHRARVAGILRFDDGNPVTRRGWFSRPMRSRPQIMRGSNSGEVTDSMPGPTGKAASRSPRCGRATMISTLGNRASWDSSSSAASGLLPIRSWTLAGWHGPCLGTEGWFGRSVPRTVRLVSSGWQNSSVNGACGTRSPRSGPTPFASR